MTYIVSSGALNSTHSLTVAPETGNARLPTVEKRTGETSRRCKVEDRSRRLDVMSEKCRGWIDTSWQFEGDTFWDSQPVKADER